VRKVVVSEFVSLDGVIEDPGGSGEYDRGGWSFQADRGPKGTSSSSTSWPPLMPSCWGA